MSKNRMQILGALWLLVSNVSGEFRSLHSPLEAQDKKILDVAAEFIVRSKYHCAALCHDRASCVGYGFHDNGRHSHCALADDFFMYQDETNPEKALRLYRLRADIMGFEPIDRGNMDSMFEGSMVATSPITRDGYITEVEFYSGVDNSELVVAIFTKMDAVTPCGQFQHTRSERVAVSLGYNKVSITDNILSFAAGDYYGFVWDASPVVKFSVTTPLNYCYQTYDLTMGSSDDFYDWNGALEYSFRVHLKYI